MKERFIIAVIIYICTLFILVSGPWRENPQVLISSLFVILPFGASYIGNVRNISDCTKNLSRVGRKTIKMGKLMGALYGYKPKTKMLLFFYLHLYLPILYILLSVICIFFIHMSGWDREIVRACFAVLLSVLALDGVFTYALLPWIYKRNDPPFDKKK